MFTGHNAGGSGVSKEKLSNDNNSNFAKLIEN